MAVAYRTTISPTQPPHDNTIMLKSDHFLNDLSPKQLMYPGYGKKNDNDIRIIVDLEKPMRCGAFVDRSRIPQYTEQDYNLPETPPFSWLLPKPKVDANKNKTDDEKLSKSLNDENSSPNHKRNMKNNANTNSLNNRIAEAAKLSNSPNENSSGTSPNSMKSRWSLRENKEDEKLLKELHFPFANQSPIGDLAKFYRECFNAPPLESLTLNNDSFFDEVDSEMNVDDLTRQLDEFELSLDEFDGLITSLGESDSQKSYS